MSMNGEPRERDLALQRAIEVVGGISELSRRLGINRQAVSVWRRCPASRARAVQTITGVPLSELRPDLWKRGEAT